MEWWGTLLISIASAAVSGIITGLFTVYVERKKQKRIEQDKRKKELQRQYELRPRLELKKYKELKQGKIESKSDFECLLLDFKDKKPVGESFFFFYDDKALDKNNLCCVEYVFINTGKTEIDSVCIISNHPRTTSIIELENRDFLIKSGSLCYEAWSNKRFIKPGEAISVKICYIKNQIMNSPISAVATIYLEDIYGYLWSQPLFCPTNVVENSNRASRKDFNNYRDVKSAIECFKNPELW